MHDYHGNHTDHDGRKDEKAILPDFASHCSYSRFGHPEMVRILPSGGRIWSTKGGEDAKKTDDGVGRALFLGLTEVAKRFEFHSPQS